MFITDKQLDDWKESIISIAKTNFINDGQLMPCVMIYGRDGNHKIYGAVFENEEDKIIFNEFIRNEIKKSDALAYIFVSEAWINKYKIDDKHKYKNTDGTFKKPSESPDRVEAVIVLFETSLRTEGITFDIDRTGKKPTLINETRQYKSEGGRFADILKTPITKN